LGDEERDRAAIQSRLQITKEQQLKEMKRRHQYKDKERDSYIKMRIRTESLLSKMDAKSRATAEAMLEALKTQLFYVTLVEITYGKKQNNAWFLAFEFRIAFVTAGAGKTVVDRHIIDILKITSRSESEVHIAFCDASSLFCQSKNANDIINTIRKRFASSFPGLPEKRWFALSISSPSRLVKIKHERAQKKNIAGGFITTYRAICDYIATNVRYDFIWDLQNIIVPKNLTVFNVNQFVTPADGKKG